LKNDEYIPNENYFLMKLFSYEIIMLAAIDYISIVVKNKKKYNLIRNYRYQIINNHIYWYFIAIIIKIEYIFINQNEIGIYLLRKKIDNHLIPRNEWIILDGNNDEVCYYIMETIVTIITRIYWKIKIILLN